MLERVRVLRRKAKKPQKQPQKQPPPRHSTPENDDPEPEPEPEPEPQTLEELGTATVDKLARAASPAGTLLTDAVSSLELETVRTLLEQGSDPNAVREPGGEASYQPDQALKMVMFRLSDCMLVEKDQLRLAEIATLLLEHGACARLPPHTSNNLVQC